MDVRRTQAADSGGAVPAIPLLQAVPFHPAPGPAPRKLRQNIPPHTHIPAPIYNVISREISEGLRVVSQCSGVCGGCFSVAPFMALYGEPSIEESSFFPLKNHEILLSISEMVPCD